MALSTAVESGTTESTETGRDDYRAGPTVSIDLGAVAHNVRVLRDHAEGADVMVVVKADGYNHGALEIARTALASGASELGVTTVDEAVALRLCGISAPILSWLHHRDTDFGPAVAHGIELGVSSAAQLKAVAAAARVADVPAAVTLKIDTGLNRNGISPADLDHVVDVLGRAVAAGSVRLRGVFSHLACADIPDHPANDRQAEVLREAVARLAAAGLRPQRTHLANSAATLTRPDLHFDMVRPGIAAYGLSPIPELGDFGLRPAMTVSTGVALVKKVPAGGGVSYGHTWIAPADTTVALIPMGYADGVRRNLSGRFDVGIGGRRFPSVGRVCMDQFVVDLGADGAGVAVGDTAVLFGAGENGGPVAQDWADTLDTIHYEVVTGIGGRVRRVYRTTDEGQETTPGEAST
ncbi:alanine racemase [Rhodococcoides yunnanense]|uniref:alanine racemase n=1 Tax=Rhodococcoides yunnanense TaxID=278209 RepID=UPI0009350685|nr:alanine racemase [Rhodococcus yunnanensis]